MRVLARAHMDKERCLLLPGDKKVKVQEKYQYAIPSFIRYRCSVSPT